MKPNGYTVTQVHFPPVVGNVHKYDPVTVIF